MVERDVWKEHIAKSPYFVWYDDWRLGASVDEEKLEEIKEEYEINSVVDRRLPFKKPL